MAWISRLRALIGRKQLSKDLEEELEFHLSMREQLNVEQGMARGEARREARRRFGNPSLWRERMSEIDLMILPQTVFQDLRYAARMLGRNAGFTIVAVLALAIGIGVNTAAFTAYKAFFERPLDGRNSGEMVNIALTLRSGIHSGDIEPFFSYPDYQAYRDQARSFSGLIATSMPQNLRLSVAGGIVSQRTSAAGTLVGRLGMLPGATNAEFANTVLVSENYFSVLGVMAPRGRLFEAGELSELAASPVALISENYWQTRFAGDPEILGKTVRLNGIAFTVVGITPHNFVGTNVEVPDFWLPLSVEPLVHPDDRWLRDRENLCCRLYGRLADGVSMEQSQTEMTLLADHLRTLHDPHTDPGKPATALLWPGSPLPLPIKRYAGLRFAVQLIMAAVWLVLVIACANVASLQLARAASRQDELSMRLSLGASRLRIIRQLLTESALLGLLAGAIALFLSWVLLEVLVALAAQALPPEYGTMIFHVTPDLGIFAYVFALSLVAGVLFGLAPALESSHAALSSAIKAKAGTSPVRSRRLRDFLMAAQVAVSLVLMIAGSMLIRSSIHALKMDTGYDSKQTVDLELQFPEGARYTADRKAALLRDLRDRLAALPGVAAITSARAPDGNGLRTAAVSLNGEKPSPQNTRTILYYTYVQANYFQTLGIPLLFGRGLQTQTGQPESVVILSQSAAQLLWPGQNPIGRSLRLGTDGQFHGKNEVLPDGPAYQAIGVARDTRGVLIDGSDSQQIYVQLPQDRLQDYPILIRARSDPAQLMSAIGPLISSVDPNLVATSSTLEVLLRQTPSVVTSSLAAAIASTIGLLGLLLASMGIYGTVSYIVVLRTREVGIRMALGAGKRKILELMLREGMRPVLAGLLVGMSLAVGPLICCAEYFMD
jgi:predicted permease